MVIKYKANVADFVFARGNWVSNWVRGRTLGLALGSYTGGNRQGTARWVVATETQLEESGAKLDCPMRIQVCILTS